MATACSNYAIYSKPDFYRFSGVSFSCCCCCCSGDFWSVPLEDAPSLFSTIPRRASICFSTWVRWSSSAVAVLSPLLCVYEIKIMHTKIAFYFLTQGEIRDTIRDLIEIMIIIESVHTHFVRSWRVWVGGDCRLATCCSGLYVPAPSRIAG